MGRYRHAKHANPKNQAVADAASRIRALGPKVAVTRNAADSVINTNEAVKIGWLSSERLV